MEISLEFSNVPVQQRFESDVEDRIGEVLSPFAERLTRVEVHLRDENAQKGGRDTRCTMEARPRGLDPLAVEAIEEVFSGSVDLLSDVDSFEAPIGDSEASGHERQTERE